MEVEGLNSQAPVWWTAEGWRRRESPGILWKAIDWRNDLYVMTPDRVIDIEKRPFVFEDRLAGASKINQSEIYRAAWHVLATAVRPLRLPKQGPRQ